MSLPGWAAALGAGAVALGALAGGEHRERPAGPRAHTDARFDFVVPAPRAVAFPLFGAWGERAWAGDDWQPAFLHPVPAADEAGAVFTLEHGPGERAVWLTTEFDAAAGRAQHVYVLPGVQAVLIDLALTEAPDGGSSRVEVRYRRTALDASADERVRALGAHDGSQGPQWAADVRRALGR